MHVRCFRLALILFGNFNVFLLQHIGGPLFPILFGNTSLQCPIYCSEQYNQDQLVELECCVCSSIVLWPDQGKLQIQLSDINRTAWIYNPKENHKTYSVEYKDGNLCEIPSRICNFTSIVHIDFSFNKISEIDSIACLWQLDTLLMKYNLVEYLKKETFSSMKYIRRINLSHNKLKLIEPGILINMYGNLFHFDVSYNVLTTVDITNMVATKQAAFCEVNYSNNNIHTLTNELNWQCLDSTYFGYGGYVDLTYNQMQTFIDVSLIGVKYVHYLGKIMLFNYGYDLRNNPWNCDCQLYPFAKLAKLVSNHMTDRDYFNVSCHSPPELSGVRAMDLFEEQNMNHLICNLLLSDKCPPKCYCFYQPHQDRTVVNCSQTGQTRMPSALPYYTNLEVDLSNNNLKDIHLETICAGNENKTNHQCYLNRISKLNLANNNIGTLSGYFLSRVLKIAFLDLRGNTFSSLPRILHSFKPCHIRFGEINIVCTCDDIWIKEWLSDSNNPCFGYTIVRCIIKDDRVPIHQITKQSLGCIVDEQFISKIYIFLGFFSLGLLLLSSAIYSYRFHLYILTRDILKMFYRKHQNNEIEYDVYISCNEEDDGVLIWLKSALIPHLETNHFKVFLPFRDSVPGTFRDTQTIDIMSRSLNYIIILSENYEGPSKAWIKREWKYAWHNYRCDLMREIVIVNFDMLDSCAQNISRRRIGTFLKLGKYIDFSNHKKMIEKEITSKLQKRNPGFPKDYSNAEVVYKGERTPLLSHA